MLFKALRSSFESRSTVTNFGSWSNFLGFNTSSKNGTVVNSKSALTLSAFYNGILILCNDYAKLPKHVVIKKDGHTEYKEDHPVDYLINDKPNQYMNSFAFDSIMMQCAILKGNGYAEVIDDSVTGQVKAIQYIDQNHTTVKVVKSDDELWYFFNGRAVHSDKVIHYRSLFSDNGITGIGIVQFAAKSLGVALSSQEFAEEYYATKGIGTGVVTSTKTMDPAAKTRYANALSATLSNKNPFKVAVVDEAGSFQHIKLTPQESMFLETNKHAIPEIARWLNIPVYKLKVTENQNNSNMEHQSISHVSDSILPWAIMNRQEYNSKLFTKEERKKGYQVFFNMNSLLQADKSTQISYYMGMVYSGVMTRNEVRQLENMNKLDGLDEPLTPVNMQTMEQLMQQLKIKENESK